MGGDDAANIAACASQIHESGEAMAQMIGDLLDFTSSQDVLGKPAGADLIEGKVSLPLILLLQREPEMRSLVQTVISEGGSTATSAGDPAARS